MNAVLPRLKLLIISHAYAATENRKKIQALGAIADVVCVTSEISQEEILGQPAAAFDNDDDLTSRSYRLVRLPRTGVSITRFMYRGLGKVIQEAERFDAVIVENEPWSFVRWQAWWHCRRNQPQALFGEFSWENVERPGLKGALLSLVYRCAVASHDFMVAGNQAAGRLFQRFGSLADRVLVAPQLGVDIDSHHPMTEREKSALRAENGLVGEGVWIGYCGRFVEEKGLLELVEACSNLRRMGLPVNLVLLGAGRLLGRFEKAKLTADWLHLLPPRPHTGIPSFLQMLDIFVLGSKPVCSGGECWEEQFGHVLIEAMACGALTLGANSGAIPEVLGDDSYVFQWGDVAALEQTLSLYVTDLALRDSAATDQRERVCKYYTHAAVAAQWVNFVRSKLASEAGYCPLGDSISPRHLIKQ